MRIKLILLFIAIISYGNLNAQTPFKFDTKFYNSIDKWVVFPKAAKDSAYMYGFIYLDVVAGPTFNLEGRLKLEGATLKKLDFPELKTSAMKYRLGGNTHLIHILSPGQLADLKTDKVPTWLALYKGGDDKHYQIAMGNMFNANGKSELAKPILEKVYQQDKKDEKLIFELSYAYNALHEYNKATDVLKIAIKEQPNNALYYKELVYSYSKLKDLRSAEEVYESFMKNVKNKGYQYEMAHNIMYQNFVNRDKAGFDKWAAVVESSNNPQFVKNVQAMREGWEKK